MGTRSHRRDAGATRAAAFTLIEMLVVILVVLLLTAIALGVVLSARSPLSSGAGTVHAMLAGARDRAQNTGSVVGVRLIRDEVNPLLVTRLQYVATPEPYSVGRVGVLPNNPSVTDWFTQSNDPNDNCYWAGIIRVGDMIRVNHGGRMATILGPDGNGDGAIDSPGTVLNLDQPLYLGSQPVVDAPYQIFRQPVPMEGADEVLLPGGVVIDTTPGLSFNVPNQITGGTMDIQFAPNGLVIGPAAGRSFVHLWLRLREATPADGSENHVLVSVFTRTGLSGASEVDWTDAVDNGTGQPPGDGIPDYFYTYAEQAFGLSAE